MFSKCSKLNLVSHVKSTNVQKKSCFLAFEITYSSDCARAGCLICQVFSASCAWTLWKDLVGRKTGLLLFLMQCELIGCEFKVSYKYLKTILLLTNHLEYLEEKECSPYNSGPLCTRSDFLGVQKSESERTQISESMLLPVIQNWPQEPRPHSTSIWQKPRQVCRTWFCCFCFVSHVGCISGHPHTLLPDGQ